jgi:hypothetical protein
LAHCSGACDEWATVGTTSGFIAFIAAETEQKTERQKTFANKMSFTSGGPEAIYERRSADFMSDALWADRRFRTFNVVDDFNREGQSKWTLICRRHASYERWSG